METSWNVWKCFLLDPPDVGTHANCPLLSFALLLPLVLKPTPSHHVNHSCHWIISTKYMYRGRSKSGISNARFSLAVKSEAWTQTWQQGMMPTQTLIAMLWHAVSNLLHSGTDLSLSMTTAHRTQREIRWRIVSAEDFGSERITTQFFFSQIEKIYFRFSAAAMTSEKCLAYLHIP